MQMERMFVWGDIVDNDIYNLARVNDRRIYLSINTQICRRCVRGKSGIQSWYSRILIAHVIHEGSSIIVRICDFEQATTTGLTLAYCHCLDQE